MLFLLVFVTLLVVSIGEELRNSVVWLGATFYITKKKSDTIALPILHFWPPNFSQYYV